MTLDSATCGALVQLAELLTGWAERINLTGHRSADAVVRRLILDALAMSQVLPHWSELIDLGSGAGFPGLPLALAHPDRRVVLVEARERRHHFQRFAIRSLGIANVTALRGRAERLEPLSGDLVVAQALAAPDQALALALPWAASRGWIALPGGEIAPEPLPPDAPLRAGPSRRKIEREPSAPASAHKGPSAPVPTHAGRPARAGNPDRIDATRVSGYRVPCGGPLRTLWLGRRSG